MISKKSTGRIWRRFLYLELLVVGLIFPSETSTLTISGSDNDSSINDGRMMDKRYIAALAKNGRLPKFNAATKRESPNDKSFDEESTTDEEKVDEKRHLGAFLKSHGKPTFGRSADKKSALDDLNYIGYGSSENEMAVKRNVAALARLGRLNAMRYGRFQPEYYGGKKRVQDMQELNDGNYFKENNEVTSPDDDCENENNVEESNNEDNNVYPNWIQNQEKRYVAALARSGRLPVWHSQRMWWGGKRDIPNAYWLRFRSGARVYSDRDRNSANNVSYTKLKDKRCKRNHYDSETPKESNEEKRNLAMLARKGILANRA